MNISGNNFLNISNQTGLSFKLESKLLSTTGSGDFGFKNYTGLNNLINFKINKNYLYDPSGRLVYNLSNNKTFTISGSINRTGYSYYINNNQVFFNNKKDNFDINNFYYNLSGTSGSIEDLKIYGDDPTFVIEISDNLYSGSNFTGNFRNLSNQDARIFKVDIQNDNFKLINNPYGSYGYTQGKNFILSGQNIQNYTQIFNIPILMSGDFGTKKFFPKITGNSPTIPSSMSMFLYVPQIYETSIIESNDQFVYTLLCKSINYNQNPAVLYNRTINLALDYYSGNTGNFTGSLTGSGQRTINYSGLITGSGYLSTGFNLTLTGSNPFINNNKNYYPILTGSGFFNINEFFYITGKNLIQDVTGILGSGISGSQWITGLFNTKITGDTSNDFSGYITYLTMSGGGNVSGVGTQGSGLGLGLTGFIDKIPATGRINKTLFYTGIENSGDIRAIITGNVSGFFTKTFQNTFDISTGFYNDPFGNNLNTNSVKSISTMDNSNKRYSGSIALTGDIQFVYLKINHYNINSSGMIAKLSITGIDAVNNTQTQVSFITGNF